MLKVIFTCLFVGACWAAPQSQRYSAPTRDFQTVSGGHSSTGFSSGFRGGSSDHFSRGDSHERFSGFRSGERFSGGSSSEFQVRGSGGGFRQGSFHASRGSSRGSDERYAGDASGEFSGVVSGGGGGGGGGRFASVGSGGGGFARGSGFGDGSISIGAPVVAIIRDERKEPVDGHYSFVFETEDGIFREESGSPSGPNGAVAQQGYWSFTYPDGTPAQFKFVADGNGFQVESDLLPIPPPMPQHAIDQIEKAERERAAGIVHSGQYREEDHFGGGFGHEGSAASFGGSSASYQGGRASFSGRDRISGSFSGEGPGGAFFDGLSGGSPESFSDDFGGVSSQTHASSFGGRGGGSFQTSGHRDSFGRTSHSISGGGRRTSGVSLSDDSSFGPQRVTGGRRFQASRKSYGN